MEARAKPTPHAIVGAADMGKFFLWLALFIIAFPNPLFANERTEAEALRDLKKGAGYLGAAIVCKEYEIADMANQHLKYLQIRDTIAGILRPEDEALLIQLQKETSQRVREDFLSSTPPFSCSELASSFENFRKETRLDPINRSLASAGVTDIYDPLKSDPLLAKSLEGLRNRTASTSSNTPSLGWADNIGKGNVRGAVAVTVTFILSLCAVWVAFRGKRFLSMSTDIVARPSVLLMACISFVFLRAAIDTFIGIHTDNALNLVMGVIGFALILMICSQRWHVESLLWSCVWMLLRGCMNIGLLVRTNSAGFVEMIATMPISALPNFTISYILPFVVGMFFVKIYRRKVRKA